MNEKKLLKSWAKQLKDIDDTIQYRKKGNSFIEGPYIVGFDSLNDISFRIEFSPEKTYNSTHYPPGFIFHIEWEGHEKMNRRIAADLSQEAFETYKYILKEIVNFNKRLSKMCYEFPNLDTKENRKRKMEKIL